MTDVSRSSSYHMPSEWSKRQSDCYQHLPQIHDSKFNCKMLLFVVFHFVVNLFITGLWVGIVIGMWLNWGGGYQRFSPTKEYDCKLVKYAGKAAKNPQSSTDENGDLRKIYWHMKHGEAGNPEDKLTVSGSGVYAVVSVVSFQCNSSVTNYTFEQILNSSRGQEVMDRMDLIGIQIDSRDPQVCHRSNLYALFDFQEKGEQIFVQIKSPLSIRYKESYISYYRIRDPLRCPRRSGSTGSSSSKDNGSDLQYFAQKSFKDASYWWSYVHFHKRSCQNGICKDEVLSGK